MKISSFSKDQESITVEDEVINTVVMNNKGEIVMHLGHQSEEIDIPKPNMELIPEDERLRVKTAYQKEKNVKTSHKIDLEYEKINQIQINNIPLTEEHLRLIKQMSDKEVKRLLTQHEL